MVWHAPFIRPDIKPGTAKTLRIIGALLVIVLLVLVRVVWLDSDAYARLSWSSALLTDEGFYFHNARNVILFGHASTDDFNNALIMPLLHVVQVAVFRVIGVGVLQTRSISIVTGLLTLLVFFCAMRRAFSPRAAWLTLLLLGFDPVFALYNRLALMDTPACLPLVCAFYAWVRAGEEKRRKGEEGWLVVCGVCLGLAYTVRGLAAIVLPVPFLLLLLPTLRQWQQEHAQRKASQCVQAQRAVPSLLFLFSSSLLPFLLGLAFVLGIYALVWYLPHHQELAKVNAFYLHHQLLPGNLRGLLANFLTAIMDSYRGVIPFLVKHSPILFLFGGIRAVQNLPSFFTNQKPHQNTRSSSENYMAGWTLILLLFISVVDYAPSRYYVLFYPALAGLAALSLEDMLHGMLHGIAEKKLEQNWRISAGVIVLIMIEWIGGNAYWYADWATHLTYRQRDADHWLAVHLPANSVLLGAVAPGLCMNNRFQCVSVIGNLCNDITPVERFASSPRYILILDTDVRVKERDDTGKPLTASQRLWAGRWKERWWMQRYPDLVRPEARLHAFPSMLRPFFTIGVYPVPPHFVNRLHRSAGDDLTESLRKAR